MERKLLLLVVFVFTTAKCLNGLFSRIQGVRSIAHLGMAGFGKSSRKVNTDVVPVVSDKKQQSSSVKDHCPTFNPSFPGVRKLHSDPPIFEIENFFSPSICDDYIKRSQDEGHKIESQTFSSAAQSQRTSTTWFLRYDKAAEMISKAQSLTGIPISNFEEPQVVRYETGQQFSWHYDAIPKSLLDSSGNRIATLIVYLNDVKTGGATVFKDLGLKVQPVKGKALLFFPCFKDGRPDDRTSHCGQITLDTKWIAQIWIHENTYNPKIPKGTNHADGIRAVQELMGT